MRIQSTESEGPPSSPSLASGRIGPASVTVWVANGVPSAEKTTREAFQSIWNRCGAFSQVP